MMTSGQCIFCAAQSSATRWGADVCSRCHSISASSIPGPEQLAAFYAEFNANYTGGGREDGAHARQTRYARRYLSVVRGMSRPSRLIDVGSSTNPFPNHAVQAGYRVTVLDYVRPAHLAAEIEFVQGAATVDAGLSGRFDVVTAFAMIEHSPDPRQTASALASYCAPGAVIVLTTPLVGDLLERNLPGKTRWFCPPEHLHLISKTGLQRIFEPTGCALIHFSRFELNPLRWSARYGMATAEAAAGLAMRIVAPHRWSELREQRSAQTQQIGLYVFRNVRPAASL